MIEIIENPKTPDAREGCSPKQCESKATGEILTLWFLDDSSQKILDSEKDYRIKHVTVNYKMLC